MERSALQLPGGFPQEIEGFGVSVRQRQQAETRLNGGAEPGVEAERLVVGGDRLLQPVLLEKECGAARRDPRIARIGGRRPVEPGLGPVEIAEGPQTEGVKAEPGCTDVGGSVRQISVATKEPPAGIGPFVLADQGRAIVGHFGMIGGFAPGSEAMSERETGGTELEGETGGEESFVDAGPVTEVAKWFAGVEGLEIEAGVVEPADCGECF